MIASVAGFISLLIWLYLLLLHGEFWRVRRNLAPSGYGLQPSKRVAVIIPARNEAEVVGRSISALLNQSGRHLIHIFLTDDNSNDGTAAIAQRVAAELRRASSLTVIQGQPLPSGWTGKLWAMQQAIERTREFAPHFLLLTDADIQHAPDSVAMLVSIAETGAYDLASWMVKLHCVTAAEKFLIPAFVFFFFKLYPPAWIANPRRKIAGAAGGSILIRPEILERAGGIAAIRNEIIDDCALARAVKSQGGKVWLGLSETTISLRPYNSLREIGRMISRTAFNQLHHSAMLLLGAITGLTGIYLLPPLLLAAHHLLPVVLGASAWLLMSLAYLPMVRFYRLHSFWALSLPFIAIFYMGATFHSAFRYWSGQGGEWKGRAQDPGELP